MKRHRRRSIRLKGYDYTRAGAYFLTMCIQDRACLFGNVDADDMQLNDAGRLVERWWLVVQWFKTMSTNEYIRGVKTSRWPRFDGRLWQRDYWERIIRDADELRRIRRYIANNPRQWGRDRNKPKGPRVAPFAGQRIVED